MNRKCKTISFNLQDSYEVRLLEHAEKKVNGDFSKYVKRLISRDMDVFDRPLMPPISGMPPVMTDHSMAPPIDDMLGFI